MFVDDLEAGHKHAVTKEFAYSAVRSVGTDVDWAVVVSSQFDSFLSSNRVRRIEDDTLWDSSEHSEIFETHLSWAVRTDGDTAVGTAEFDVCFGHAEHSDLIISSIKNEF